VLKEKEEFYTHPQEEDWGEQNRNKHKKKGLLGI